MPGSQDFEPDPRNDKIKVWVNGKIIDRDKATVSVFDAGFLMGDGVWEGLRLHKGALLFLDAHLDRLYAGARDIGLDIGLCRDRMKAALEDTVAANNMHHGAHLRLMATRGIKSAANQDPRNAPGPATIVILAEYKNPSPSLAANGLALATSSIRCTPADMFDMRLNSHSRLPLIRALLDAINANADEALMLDPGGFVSSCNATNFFWIKDGEVRTSTGEFCFNGVTRGAVIRLCDANQIPIRLDYFRVADAHAADEAFVTGTFGGITPVRQVDGHVLPGGTPGPLTAKLRGLYEALKDEQALYAQLKATP